MSRNILLKRRSSLFVCLVLASFAWAGALSAQQTGVGEEAASDVEATAAHGLLEVAPRMLEANEPDAGSVIELIRRRGVVRIGFVEAAPWAFRDVEGEWMGFDIDLARALAHDLDVEPEFHPVPWTHAMADLEAREVDLIVGGLEVTPDHALFVNFSAPVATSAIELITTQDMAKTRDALNEFNSADVKIGVVGDSPIVVSLGEATVTRFDSEEEMFTALDAGDVHAVVSYTPQPELHHLLHPGKYATPLPGPLAERAEAIALRKGDPDALNYLNSWVTYHHYDGLLESRWRYWFKGISWTNHL